MAAAGTPRLRPARSPGQTTRMKPGAIHNNESHILFLGWRLLLAAVVAVAVIACSDRFKEQPVVTPEIDGVAVLDTASMMPKGRNAWRVGPTAYHLVQVNADQAVDADAAKTIVIDSASRWLGRELSPDSLAWWSHVGADRDSSGAVQGTLVLGEFDAFDGHFRSQQWIADRFRTHMTPNEGQYFVLSLDGSLTTRP